MPIEVQEGQAQKSAQQPAQASEQARERAVQQILSHLGVAQKLDYDGENLYLRLAQRIADTTNEFNRQFALDKAKTLLSGLVGALGQEKLDDNAHFYFSDERKIDVLLKEPEFFVSMAKEFAKGGNKEAAYEFSAFCYIIAEMKEPDALFRVDVKSISGMLQSFVDRRQGAYGQEARIGAFLSFAAKIEGSMDGKESAKFWKKFSKLYEQAEAGRSDLLGFCTDEEVASRIAKEPKKYLEALSDICKIGKDEQITGNLLRIISSDWVFGKFLENPDEVVGYLGKIKRAFSEKVSTGENWEGEIKTRPAYMFVFGALNRPVFSQMFGQDPGQFLEFAKNVCYEKQGLSSVLAPKYISGMVRAEFGEQAASELYEFSGRLSKKELQYLPSVYGMAQVQGIEGKEARFEKVKEIIGTFKDKLGIDLIYRYSTEVLENAYETATNPQFSQGKKLALIVTAKADENGAFEQNNEHFLDLIKHDFCLVLSEASTDGEVGERVKNHGGLGKDALEGRKFNLLLLGAHGEPGGMTFSNIMFSSKGRLDRDDLGKLGGKGTWSEALEQDATVVLWSCSTGAFAEPVSGLYMNMQETMRALAGRKVFAPNFVASIRGMAYDENTGNVIGAYYSNKNGDTYLFQ